MCDDLIDEEDGVENELRRDRSELEEDINLTDAIFELARIGTNLSIWVCQKENSIEDLVLGFPLHYHYLGFKFL